MKKKHIAIIGAGVSGSFLSYLLKQTTCYHISLFDKSRGTGGRCSVYRHPEFGDFNMGAQFFTNKNNILSPYFNILSKNQLIKPLSAPTGYISSSLEQPAFAITRYEGIPSMNAFLKFWTDNVSFKPSTSIKALKQKDSQWTLIDDREQSHGPFDICILTLPYEQGIPLWTRQTHLALPSTKSFPCWSLFFVTQRKALVWPNAFVCHQALAWYQTQVIQQHLQRWVLHASSAWSQEHLETNPQTVEKKLLTILADFLNITLTPKFIKSHRWRYAYHLTQTQAPSFLWDPEARLGYAADWLVEGRVEGAMTSAYLLYKKLLSQK